MPAARRSRTLKGSWAGAERTPSVRQRCERRANDGLFLSWRPLQDFAYEQDLMHGLARRAGAGLDEAPLFRAQRLDLLQPLIAAVVHFGPGGSNSTGAARPGVGYVLVAMVRDALTVSR